MNTTTPPTDLTNTIIKEIIQQGYGRLVEEKIEQGWSAYIITFMYHRIRGSRESVIRQMEREVERVYATMLTRIVRDPHAPKFRDQLPILIVCPDYPVPKHAKKSLREVKVNDGAHEQGVVLVAPGGRLNCGLDEHFEMYQERYVRPGDPLQRVHVAPITENSVYAVEYTFKSVQRRRLDFDNVLILPRTRSELAQSHKRPGLHLEP